MKLLLVEPAVDNVRAKRKKSVIGPKIFRTPPLGLMVVAALTPRDLQVEIIDEHTQKLNLNTDADIVGINVNACSSRRAYHISEQFRKKGRKVILGGFHVTFNQKEASKQADSIVIGEAEAVWKDVIKDFKNDNLKKLYDGTKYENLSIPIPRRDLVRSKGFYFENVIQATRGCPSKCDFCGINHFFGGKFKKRPVPEVIKDIKSMKGFRFLFTDDNLTADPIYAKRLFKALIPLKKKWMGMTNTTIAKDDELLRLARKCGCVGLFLGLESIHQENLKNSQKYLNAVDEYKSIIRKLHDYGIAVAGGTMFGFDNDSLDTFKRSLNFYLDSGIDIIQVSPLTPFPGTPLYSKLKKEKRIITSNFDDYDIYKVVFKPKQMSPEDLEEGLQYLRKNFYTFKNVVRRTYRALLYGGLLSSYMVFILNYGYYTCHKNNLGYPP
jgi:radical SAM superfamily enzyme YgiQ (UPF0313 family)